MGTLYSSLAAVLRLRGIECIRAVPWGIVAAAFSVLGFYEFAVVSLLSVTWPEVAQWTSALRLVVESPGIVAIAYAAARYRRSAAFVLGAAMLCVTSLLNVFTTEAISTSYVIANDNWVYRLDESNDGGKSWNEGRTEYTLRRSK
jgi:hypothetical protein